MFICELYPGEGECGYIFFSFFNFLSSPFSSSPILSLRDLKDLVICTIHVVFGDSLQPRRDELKALADVMVNHLYYSITLLLSYSLTLLLSYSLTLLLSYSLTLLLSSSLPLFLSSSLPLLLSYSFTFLLSYSLTLLLSSPFSHAFPTP